MQLSNLVEMPHPYFTRVSCDGDVCEVELSVAFPAKFRTFMLRAAPDIWDGFKEVESNLGLVEDGERVLWLSGHGRSREEAVQNALATFVNWVVHPADVNSAHFRFRELA